MSKEVKIGLLALVAIISAIWGYKFVKGQNLFQNTSSFYTTFDDVSGLAPSAIVSLNGFKIGQVTSIELNKKDVKKMDVHVRIEGKIPIPKDARIVMKSEGLVGGKFLSLEFDQPCDGSNCARGGDFLEGHSLGLIGSMLGENELTAYMEGATGGLDSLISQLGREGKSGNVHGIVRSLDASMQEMAVLSKNMNALVAASSRSLTSTLSNLDKITRTIANNETRINAIVENLSATTEALKKARLDETIQNANTLFEKSSTSMASLDKTIQSLDAVVVEMKALTNDLNAGEGTLGKLLKDESIYNRLDETTRQLNLLLQDLRLNPKRYLNVSVFGKKGKEYIVPEDDPAQK